MVNALRLPGIIHKISHVEDVKPANPDHGEMWSDQHPGLFGTLCLVGIWIAYFRMDRPRADPSDLTLYIAIGILTCFFIYMLFGYTIRAYYGTVSTKKITLSFIYGVNILLIIFSYVYWLFGSKQNFSSPLTKFDAFYFALGNLTTAGTGSINAISELGRILQAIQIIIDSVVMLFIFSLVISRFTSKVSLTFNSETYCTISPICFSCGAAPETRSESRRIHCPKGRA